MSNLRLIDDTSFSSVSSVDITDCFSSDYDIYLITGSNLALPDAYVNSRLINTQGQVITTNYAHGMNRYYSDNTTASESKSTNTNLLNYYFSYDGGGGSYQGGFSLWVFTPYQSSRYTQTVFHSSGTNAKEYNTKGIRIHKELASIAGIRFLPSSGSFTGNLKTYGIRVD